MLAPQPFYQDRGTPIALKQVLKALSEIGVELEVVTYPAGEDPGLPGVRISRVANPFMIRTVPVGLSIRKIVLDIALWVEARRLLSRNRYDAIQASEEAAFIAVMARNAASGRRLPVIYDMQSSLPDQLAELPLFGGRLMRWLADRCERWLLQRADLVVTSAGLGRRAAPLAGGPVREWSFPGQAGEASDAQGVAELRRALSIPAGSRVVLYAGNFASYQGVPLLLDAIPRVLKDAPSTIFVLVGAEDTARLSIPQPRILRESLRVVDRRPRWEMPRYYALADLVVSPRLSGRNLPLKILDYLAAGKPLVATDVPAHRAILDERFALLVKPDPEGLADGIVRVLLDSDLRDRLASNASGFADDHLGWRQFVEWVRELYQSILWRVE